MLRNICTVRIELISVGTATMPATIIPLDMLANYLAGAQITLMQWWLEKRRPHSAETLTLALHRLQRAVIRDAFGISDEG